MARDHSASKIDLEWSDDGVVPAVVYPNLEFLFRQMVDLTLEEVHPRHGEFILDVGCGRAVDGAQLSRRGATVVGLEPSKVMLDRAREYLSENNARVGLAQGIGESLPFKAHSFDKVMCKGALDHFLSPDQTMEEMARVLKPSGEIVVSIANFDSLGFRLGKRLHPATQLLCPSLRGERQVWELPPDHTYKLNHASLSSLMRQHFEIKQTTGISLLFGLPLLGSLLNRLPRFVSFSILRVLDRLARPFPSLADVILMRCSPLSRP
jgi:SAM-dependent methyltransferase